ncbi:GTP-binding protein [Desulfitobacterium chlororespirans]|uniref:GTPase, G3E family n=1 Tax=Desulfitobacterium chlororespirans DSM 11544 TaxID=1121395 RepID=A0A1M7SHY0_9FIRM|nr:GTP-binding protein [Desulfitobacterium chlororespirans]SHN58063.1 GTPase, G3E family [Desulfitobacterium chlororespirans DSM 11544]
MKTKLILVGGFLGAGKTTLLGELARQLSQKGRKVGLITNDQASELVDTVYLEQTGTEVSEVSGSCFCCNFPGFIEAIDHVNAHKPADIIIAEPVGSCTDLSATILQPLKEKFADKLSVAPLTVLVDPRQLTDILDGRTAGLHPSAAYILRKQLGEADLILINKTDLLTPLAVEILKKRTAEEWPLASVYAISAKTGEGLAAWLHEAQQRTGAGTHLAEVDYDTYAEGEAVLGWLNATIELQSQGADWDTFGRNLLNSLRSRFGSLNAAIGHVKLLIATDKGYVIGNITGAKDSLDIRESAGTGQKAQLTLNARVQMEPDILEGIVKEEIAKAQADKITATIAVLKCLKPGRPNPTYRYGTIVG